MDNRLDEALVNAMPNTYIRYLRCADLMEFPFALALPNMTKPYAAPRH